jgi:hypothetical protein
MRLVWMLTFLGLASIVVAQQTQEAPAPIASARQTQDAPTGFDNRSNGFVDDATHATDLETFAEVETIDEGLGPLHTRSRAANVTKTPRRAGPARSPSCASGIADPMAVSAIRRSRLPVGPRSFPAAR